MPCSNIIDGFTGDQRFFMGWAQAWANRRTPAALTSYVRMNEHSPPIFRVNGVVRNVDRWYEGD
jgi:predicted metalloendopeptidase